MNNVFYFYFSRINNLFSFVDYVFMSDTKASITKRKKKLKKYTKYIIFLKREKEKCG